jgi:polysaccharide biosynthesis/export protein
LSSACPSKNLFRLKSLDQDLMKIRAVVVTTLLLPVLCFAQTRLTTPMTGNTQQCVGSDCQRGQGDATPQQGTPQRPNLTGSSEGTSGERTANDRTSNDRTTNERQQPNGELPADMGNAATARSALYPKTEFEKFVSAALGQELPFFGHQFFADVPTTFAPVDRVPVRSDYVIGPGDELLIRAWGKIDLDARVVVDRTGQIYLPRVGSISVSGLRYEQLSGYLHSAVGKFFRDFDLSVTMGQLRSIQVFVLGYARRPGTYTVSSLSTLMNAVFASGGPAANGSMRHVQLKRNNAVVSDLDFYDVILKGDKTADAPLQSGDVIYIPPVGPLVALAGSVNGPAIYELRKPTSLGDAVEISGGLTTVAETRRVALERIDERAQRRFEEFALDADGLKRQLKDGDIVRIFPISPKIGNAVTLRGNVAQPGRYAFRDGMRVSDLIPSRDALITRGYWNRQNVIVPGDAKNDPFAARDEKRRAEKQRQRAESVAENAARGEGQGTAEAAPQDVESDEDLRIGIKHRGSEINWQYAVIERMNQKDLTTQLIPFNLGNAIDQPSSADNQTLAAGDIVTIFSQEDVPVATENRTTFVQIEGEVNAPGVYRMAPGETLRDAVKKAGGLGSHAYLFASELLRESTRKKREERLQQMVQRMQRELTARSGSVLGNSPEEEQQERQRIQEQQALLARLEQLKPTGRIVLELKPMDDTLDAVPAMALEDGDRFFIPSRDDTVQVLGSVYNENSFRYRAGKNLSDYLNHAGGPTRDGDKGRLFVIRADGSVVSRQQYNTVWSNRFDGLKLMPGDAIVVPERYRTTTFMRELKDWSQVFAQFALGAAAIKVLAP